MLKTITKINLILLCTLFSYHDCFSRSQKLIFAIDIVRHGDRTSLQELPKRKHVWAEGLGQLTARGMQQEYELGLRLDKRYRLDNQLLPKHYHMNDIYVRSTGYDRTIMSAQSLLLGLYPLGTGAQLPDLVPALPARFQPVPVHSVPIEQDNIFYINLSTHQIRTILEKYISNDHEWKKLTTELEPNLKRWSEQTGYAIKDITYVIGLADILTTYLSHDIELPAQLSNNEAKKIITAGHRIHALLFKPNEIGDLVGSSPLRYLTNYLKQAVEKKTVRKLIVISAHDSTILALMSALHVPLSTTPDYATDLNFSLYETETGQYFVSIHINDQAISIPGCHSNECEFSQFLKLYPLG
ncbi:MAG: histidine phosphatase family protein [Legionella sp.]